MSSADISRSAAIRFIILLGIVSLFADMTYEGARSITGPFLGTLGASALVVGFVAGLGEFLGYGFRFVSGFLADRTHLYWRIAIIGYLVNLIAVPLLAFAGNWWFASLLIIVERIGKGIRIPARDAMLSHAAARVGMGWGFGVHEALDQAGAMMGPLLVTLILYWQGQYRFCFAFLAIPAIASLSSLFFSRLEYPNPQALEVSPSAPRVSFKNRPIFWIYLGGASLVALGYADFALIAYHFSKMNLLSPLWIPLTYAIALGTNIVMAPVLGLLYDRQGFIVLIFVTFLASFFSPLVFLGDAKMAVVGMVFWGVGMGAQGSLMRAIVANLIPKNRRGSAYGIFNAVFGLFWFIGSTLMGFLYEVSLTSLVIFSMLAQLFALPMLAYARYLIGISR